MTELATSAPADVVATADEPLAAQVARAYLMSFRGQTLDAYRTDLTQWFTWCAGHAVDPLAVRRVHVDAWARSMEGLAAATSARKVSAVRGYYRYAVEEDVIGRNPVPAQSKRLPMAKVSTKSQTLGPDIEEARTLLAVAGRAGTREHAIVTLLLHQGLRVSELLGIRLGDLERQRGHHTVTISRKGGERQTLALAPVTLDAVDAQRAALADQTPTALLFPDVDRFGVHRLVKRLARAAGMTKTVSPHSLRHACVTTMLDRGVPIRDVQVFVGHASPTTTQRYDLGREQLDRSPAYAISGVFA